MLEPAPPSSRAVVREVDVKPPAAALPESSESDQSFEEGNVSLSSAEEEARTSILRIGGFDFSLSPHYRIL